MSNKRLIQSFLNPLKSIYTDAYNSQFTEKMKNANALSFVDLFGSLEEFMEVLAEERERERDRRRRKKTVWVKVLIDFLFIFRREFNDLMILDMTCH